MTGAGFTPGPWQIVEKQSGPNGAAICAIGGLRVGTISNKADKPIDQKWADARLIAAAPEIYGALESLLGQFDQAHDALGVERSKSAKNAIVTAFTVLRKARGETPNDGSIPSGGL